MAQNVSLIGLQPDELSWIRLLVSLLRHPDPATPELARQALLYVSKTSGTPASSEKLRRLGIL
jgi:hypothetical protein